MIEIEKNRRQKVEIIKPSQFVIISYYDRLVDENATLTCQVNDGFPTNITEYSGKLPRPPGQFLEFCSNRVLQQQSSVVVEFCSGRVLQYNYSNYMLLSESQQFRLLLGNSVSLLYEPYFICKMLMFTARCFTVMLLSESQQNSSISFHHLPSSSNTTTITARARETRSNIGQKNPLKKDLQVPGRLPNVTNLW